MSGIETTSSFKSVDIYLIPKQIKNYEGKPRRVGVEVEYVGPDNNQSAYLAKQILGGTIEQVNPHLTHLIGSELGDMEFMLDTEYVHPDEPDEPATVQSARDTLGKMVSSLVPQEMVTSPIEICNLSMLNKLTDALAKAGAKGTHESILYAFGLHLNTEIASTSPEYLLSVMRAMVILEPKVKHSIQPDFSREIMRWAQSYKGEYVRVIMNDDYSPDMQTLITDYIRLNPGRSYHLDMLPIFRHLEAEIVSDLIGDKYPASRPTFHYRLPNSGLGLKNWSIRKDWNIWVEIENFASEIGPAELDEWRKASGL